MGKIIEESKYLDVKPKGMGLDTYVMEKLEKHFENKLIEINYQTYLDPHKLNEVEYTKGWIFKSKHKRWKHQILFKVYRSSGDVHIVSFSDKVSIELVYELFMVSIKDSDCDIVFHQKNVEYYKMNDEPDDDWF